ncbi:MAG: hypothetical protein Q4F57_03510 [Weeksellaceae bacterium]|nr:hypothetical protein [Weeksellaceae bacterium]
MFRDANGITPKNTSKTMNGEADKNAQRSIFYHVGLSKTGSTFLQKKVFPYLEDIEYIPTNKYRKFAKLIPETSHNKILVSREFDQQFYIEVKKFAEHYPQAIPIIVLREHSSWALSNFKRFVKNGHPYKFQDFIDIVHDKGHFKKIDFNYSDKIQFLKNHFHNPPLILLYDDLVKNPMMYLETLEAFLHSRYNGNKHELKPNHVSYSEKSLKSVRFCSQYVPFKKKLEVHRQPVGYIYNLYANIVRYSIIHSSKLLPDVWFRPAPLVTESELIRLQDYFREDWNNVCEIAKNQRFGNS